MEQASIVQVEGQVKDGPAVITTTPQLTPQQMHDMMVWMKASREAYGAQCRKPSHVHRTRNPAGAKLERKLAQQGSLYSKVSLVQEMYNDIQQRKFKEKQACQK